MPQPAATYHTVVSRSTWIYSTGCSPCQEAGSMYSASFLKSFFKVPMLAADTLPLLAPFMNPMPTPIPPTPIPPMPPTPAPFCTTDFFRFLIRPNMQNIRQAVRAAAMHPRAAKTPPGSSSNLRAVPHSSSDSSKPLGQLWWPEKERL